MRAVYKELRVLNSKIPEDILKKKVHILRGQFKRVNKIQSWQRTRIYTEALAIYKSINVYRMLS